VKTAIEVLLALGGLALFYFFGLPWVKPLYQRYRDYVTRKALGK
jgi:hypothetical protein